MNDFFFFFQENKNYNLRSRDNLAERNAQTVQCGIESIFENKNIGTPTRKNKRLFCPFYYRIRVDG